MDRIGTHSESDLNQQPVSTLLIKINKWKGRSRISKISALQKQIEDTRRKMYEAYKKNPEDPEVLAISQQLDALLNQYEHMQKNDKKPT